jgi:hypothetical protein
MVARSSSLYSDADWATPAPDINKWQRQLVKQICYTVPGGRDTSLADKLMGQPT